MTMRPVAAAFAAFVLAGVAVAAQAPSSAPQPVSYRQLPARDAAVLKVGNRPVITFRAEVLSAPSWTWSSSRSAGKTCSA
jgi:hypothetical protein